MPSKQALMASSLPVAAAAKLGADPLVSFTAAGTSQGTATSLTSNFANVSTPAINNGVIIALPFERLFIYNSGPNTLLVYPPVGGTIVGSALNAALGIAPASMATLEGDDFSFFANVGI